MANDVTETGSLYSQKVGFIYVFNLIVGTGALTMPRAFASAGWLISSIGVTVLGFMSYMTLTFVIEAMAVANAMLKIEKAKGPVSAVKPDSSSQSSDLSEQEDKPLLVYTQTSQNGATGGNYGSSGVFDAPLPADVSGVQNPIYAKKLSNITKLVEMGQMASMFYPRKLMVLTFYITLCIYLFGDLAIYAAAVPKSLRDVACTYTGYNASDNSSSSVLEGCNDNLTDSDICWESAPSINRGHAYRIFLAAFILILGPFLFFNVQKTKYLQLLTSAMRWLSFSMMIVLATIQLTKGQGDGHPPVADFQELPTLFGVCVYSFMCHHSLPSLVTPIKEKSRLSILFGGDYLLILTFYSVLSFTGIFTFSSLNDLYTLNFFCDSSSHPVTKIAFIRYFLALFPVFTLSTNFPIIGITLRNNLITLGHFFVKSIPLERFIFPLITIIPPLAIAFGTSDVSILVSITGSYAGAGIQYVIPVALVYYGRKQFRRTFGDNNVNPHKSPFGHGIWLIAVLVWFLFCVILVTVHHIISGSIH